MQIIMTGLVSTVMALNIFILANYDYPFSGDIHVSPTALELNRQIFKSVYAEDLKAIRTPEIKPAPAIMPFSVPAIVPDKAP